MTLFKVNQLMLIRVKLTLIIEEFFSFAVGIFGCLSHSVYHHIVSSFHLFYVSSHLLGLEKVKSSLYSYLRYGLSILLDLHLSMLLLKERSLLLVEVAKILTQFLVVFMNIFDIIVHLLTSNS